MLFQIELQGAGTADVESLASYIYRSSYDHGIFVGEFFRYLRKVCADNPALGVAPEAVPTFIKVSAMVRVNRSSSAILSALEESTAVSLGQSRLLFMTSDVWRTPGEVAPGFRWCPECMCEWSDLGQQAFFKLVWHLSSVTHCTHHRTELVSECSFCGCDQATYRRKRDIGLCQNCGRNLGRRNPDKPAPAIASSWEQNGADVHQFFIDLADHGSSEESFQGGIWRSLRDLYDHYRRSHEHLGLCHALPKGEWINFYKRHNQITFKTARRLSYELGIDLYTLISGNAIHSTQVLNQKWLCELPEGFCEVRVRQKRNHDEVLARLKEYLSPDCLPRPVKDVARELDVSVGYLRYRYPTVLAKLVSRHQTLVRDERRKTKDRATNEALQYFTSDEYSSFPKSRKQAYVHLRAKTGLPKFLLKGAIADVYAVLYSPEVRREDV